MVNNKRFKVLVVCMGNICRSPTAQSIIEKKCQEAGLDIDIDSAGTIDYHRGKAPDPRAVQAAKLRGYDLSGLKARQVEQQDFDKADLILAADHDNLADLQAMAEDEHQVKVHLLLEYAQLGPQAIPDPYYGGDEGFKQVIDLLEQASDNLVKRWSQTKEKPPW